MSMREFAVKLARLLTSDLVRDLRLPTRQSADYDIAKWNLVLASGLPGSEDLNLDLVLDRIEEWTEKVRHATSRNFDQSGTYLVGSAGLIASGVVSP